MKFLLDESVEYRLAIFLRVQGHDVTAVAHDYPHALADREVLAIAVREGRIVITSDRDFGELVIREHVPHAGVILLRLGAAPVADKLERLRQVLHSHADALQHLIVVTPARVRVRRMASH